MSKRKNETIIYVNFSPYENAGRILDYLLETFETVILFSFNFHKLGKKQKSSKIITYRNNQILSTHTLFQLPLDIPGSMVFILLPIRSAIIAVQVLWHSYFLKRRFSHIEYYFTVNAFTAWLGIVLKRLKTVNKTIFWVWDYYPPLHGSKIINLMRWLYWQYDKASIVSDKLVFLNQRLLDLRKDIGILPQSATYPIIPIGTKPQSVSHKTPQTIVLGLLGVQKKSQGLDLLFDNAELLTKTFPSMRLEVIGAGPDEQYFHKRAKETVLPTTFYGFLPQDKEIEKIISDWSIGIAPYVPEEGNVVYYTDPSKIKYYFSYGVPVITTRVFRFSEEIEKNEAGIIINYDINEFIDAIKKILSDYTTYSKNAKEVGNKYYYKKLYPEMFNV